MSQSDVSTDGGERCLSGSVRRVTVQHENQARGTVGSARRTIPHRAGLLNPVQPEELANQKRNVGQ